MQNALKDASCVAKRRRNESAPISCLPSEILAFIFSILRDVEEPYFNVHPIGDAEDGIGWIQVTYVCSRWRKVALDHLTLWEKVHVVVHVSSTTLWTEELLKRSSTAPLRLGYSTEYFPGQAISRSFVANMLILLMREHLARVQHLSFSDSWAHFADVSPDFTDIPAPEVRSVYLENDNPEESMLFVPVNIFDNAPRLTALTLEDFHVPFDAHVYQQLTSLSIHHGSWQEPFLSVHDLRDLFQRTVNLRTLALENVVPRDMAVHDDGVPLDRSSIALPPSVVSVKLGAGTLVRDALDLATCFFATGDTSIEVDIMRAYSQPTQLSHNIPQVFARHTSPDTVPRCLSLRLSALDDTRNTMSVGTRNTAWPNTPLEGAPMEISADNVRVRWTDHGNRLLVGGPSMYGVHLATIVDLFLDMDHNQPPDVWIELFRHARDVRRIHVPEQTIFTILPALVHREAGTFASETTGDEFLLPRLESLCVTESAPNRNPRVYYRTDYHSLFECLHTRREAGLRLHEVQVPKVPRGTCGSFSWSELCLYCEGASRGIISSTCCRTRIHVREGIWI